MTDPKVTILNLLVAGWAVGTVPKFSTDWYDKHEEMPQVVVSHVSTNPFYIGLSDTLEDDDRRFIGVYYVDCWTTEKDLRYLMVRDCDRILHEKCNNPGDKLEFMESTGWVDMDEPFAHPRIFRSRMRIEVLYYE